MYSYIRINLIQPATCYKSRKMIRDLERISVFMRNLEFWGFEFSVNESGRLRVAVPPDKPMPPILEKEIGRRAHLILEVLREREAVKAL